MWSCRQKWGYVDSINRIRGGILKVGKVVEVCKNYTNTSHNVGRSKINAQTTINRGTRRIHR